MGFKAVKKMFANRPRRYKLYARPSFALEHEDGHGHGHGGDEGISTPCDSPVTVLPPSHPNSHPRTTCEPVLFATPIDNMSATEAERIARHRAQFASLIVKAQCPEATPEMIESFRAAELAKAQELAENNRQSKKIEIEAARRAARLALCEMEKKVVIVDNLKTEREFRILMAGKGHLLVD